MSISVEAKDLGKVVQLAAKSDGWRGRDVLYSVDRQRYIGGNPETTIHTTPEQLVEPLQQAWLTTQRLRPTDFNGPKVGVNRLVVTGSRLVVLGATTDYFTLWGIPKADATKQLFEKHEKDIVRNRTSASRAQFDVNYRTDLPWGLCTHNTLIDKNGDILMMVRSQSQGFNAGRVSVTQEEQTEPSDLSPFSTSARSFQEELGLEIKPERVKLLGVAMEKGAAYAAFAYIAQADALAKDIVETWKTAKDHNENTALFAVPMSQIDRWTQADEVGPDVWGQHFLAGGISPDAKLKLHATSSWRIGLAQEYTKAAK